MASAGHDVVGYDADESTVSALQQAAPPVAEAGLVEMLRQGIDAGRLRFTSDRADAVRDADVVWITYDTPVDDDDRADVDFVLREVESLMPSLRDGAVVLVSSQLPVGSTRALETKAGSRKIRFASSPENLRLGKAINAFMKPDRIVVGVRGEDDRRRITELLAPLQAPVEWMSVESAEMTKHAVNAFLATSVAFMNEIATICERVGADARQVERGLKTERRIGPLAYLSPGAAFAGGTLARDIVFLARLGKENAAEPAVIEAVKTSNDAHRRWPQRRLQQLLGEVRGSDVAVWGLTYKPGTDTLRRSAAIELCHWLLKEGARVTAHDPAVKALPPELASRIGLAKTPAEAASSAKAVVVMTEWPEYREINGETLAGKIVIDANRFLASRVAGEPSITYVTVGKPL